MFHGWQQFVRLDCIQKDKLARADLAKKTPISQPKSRSCWFFAAALMSAFAKPGGPKGIERIRGFPMDSRANHFPVSPPSVFWCNRWRVSISIGTCAATGFLEIVPCTSFKERDAQSDKRCIER